MKDGLLRVFAREPEEILKQDTAVAGFILMLPAGAALIPIFERFLEMKLNRVDELSFSTPYHHLIAAQVRSSEQFEAGRY